MTYQLTGSLQEFQILQTLDTLMKQYELKPGQIEARIKSSPSEFDIKLEVFKKLGTPTSRNDNKQYAALIDDLATRFEDKATPDSSLTSGPSIRINATPLDILTTLTDLATDKGKSWVNSAVRKT